MNCTAKIQCRTATPWLPLFAGTLVFALCSCAPAPEVTTAPPPAVDLFKLEADVGQALSMSTAANQRLDTLVRRLDSLEQRLRQTDSVIAALPLARNEENINQVTLLREDVNFLRSYLENQHRVPLINPPKKQVPTEALAPAPAEYTQAMTAFDQGRHADAVELFEKVPALYPENTWNDDAWYWSAESSLRAGDFARALAAFQKVLTFTVSDKHDDAQYGIGVCYLRLGDRDRAIAELRKVQVHYPQSDRVPQAQSELNKLQSR